MSSQVNIVSDSQDVSGLSLACAGGHEEAVYELLKAGADPNVVLKVPTISFSCNNFSKKGIVSLIKSPHLQDGVTCVLEAARHGYVDIVKLLLDHKNGAGGVKSPRKVSVSPFSLI